MMAQRVLVQTWDCGSVAARARVAQIDDEAISAHEIDIDQVEIFGAPIALKELSPAVVNAIREHFYHRDEWEAA